MAKKPSNNDENRITNEKPVSLYPLKFIDALKALIETKPEDLEKAERKEKKTRKHKD